MKYLTIILLAVVASACAGQTVKPALPIQQTTPPVSTYVAGSVLLSEQSVFPTSPEPYAKDNMAEETDIVRDNAPVCLKDKEAVTR